MRRPAFYPEIALASAAGLLLEIAYTRIFSFKFFYFFTYLILGIGLMGLGAGGVLVAVSKRLRELGSERLLPRTCFGGAAAVLVSYWLIAPTQLNTSRLSADPIEGLTLAFVCVVLALPFLAIGVAVSTILATRPERANRLYGADLLGAAVGCAAAIPLLRWLDPPRTLALSAMLLVLAGIRLAVQTRALRAVGAVLAVVVAVPLATGAALPDPRVDDSLTYEEYRKAGLVRFSQWNPVFRIDVAELPFSGGDTFLVFHDGDPGSGLRRFDGNREDFLYLLRDGRALPFQVLPEHPRVLIIGSAGGHEVVASLLFGASHVTGVELNPVTLSLLTDHFADITGHLDQDPRVTFVNGDARWFLAQDDQKYDLIWFVAPDSYSAMNAATSGAFVLSESYLYTVEALRSTVRHLSDRGVLCAQFGEIDYAKKPNRTTRFIATAREAFAEEGIDDFSSRALVASTAGFPPQLDSVIVLGRSPFSKRQVDKFVDYTPKVEMGVLRYAPGHGVDQTPVNQVIARDDDSLAEWYSRYPYQVEPVHDDSPFFWHFVSFSHAIGSQLSLTGGLIDYEHAVGEKITFVLLVIVVVLAAVFLFSPFYFVRSLFSELPHKGRAATYFAALGLGFMFIEVALIQSLTLFLGYPTYSLSVTLFALLLFSGAGSLLAETYFARSRWSLAWVLGALVFVLLAYRFGAPVVTVVFAGDSLATRIPIAIALVAPLGLCLGAFLPGGLVRVAAASAHPREYVAWSWAVNGFFSVAGSVGSTILAMTIGYDLLMLTALAIYAVGVAAMMGLGARAEAAG